MAPHNLAACRLCVAFLLLSTATLSSAAASSLDAICTIPSPRPKHHDVSKDDAFVLLNLFQLNAGYFFGGEDIHFAKDDSNSSSSFVTRSFSFFPHSVDPTSDSDLLHVAATLDLSGGRARSILTSHRRRHRYVGDHSIKFYLDGYYSSATDELCMTGQGTYPSDDGTIQRLEGVVLKLRMPGLSNLSDPFVTGRLKGASFETISLVAYAEGAYHYGESASCPTLHPSSTSTARGALQALGASFSCAHLKEHLATSYKLQYSGGGAHAPGSSPPMGLQAPRLHVGQVQCTKDGEVRAYAAFYNGTNKWRQLQPHPPFMVGDEVLVAEGRWDSERSLLCLTACHVVYSESEMSVSVKECGIAMSFWFPGAWTIRERSVLAGMIWDSNQAPGGFGGPGEIRVSSIDSTNHRSNFLDVRYDYTMVEEARKLYLNDPVLSDARKKVKGSFVAPNYTDHDFAFHFQEAKDSVGSGRAYPVTIGSAMVYGDELAADDSFSRHAVVDTKQELVNVSYDIRHHVPPADWVRPKNNSYMVSLEERRITAEGVFDPKTGVMCMMACREHDSSMTDCQILIIVHFASLDRKDQGHGKGAISSLRNKTTDPLFFEKIEIVLYGMYSEQVSESISRMDLESVMLVISTTLSCVITILQIFHVKKRPEAAAATSITMLVILALGYVAPLVISSEALFLSRRSLYMPFPFDSYVPYELSQAMMRAPTLIALLLQLRLIQLAWSARKTATDAGRARAEASWAGERRALWLCVPLYLIGGALTFIAHAVNARRAAREGSLTVRLGPVPATLWEDLVSSAGLVLDAFLLPQVATNAFASVAGAAGVRALSPWFYVGGTVVRAMPHVYDVIRARGYVPNLRPSYVYASPRYDRFGVGWDVAVPCGATLLAVLVFLQQRVRLAAAPLFPSRRRLGEYEMVSNL
ncbi:hypothetical protein SEVIR_5G273100v4 [Setaria viridis]|uniref:RING-type E3 ubiquitin transferase n=1 Tax=Setaria viridis TaxID=4556 RepID=A0A4U6UIK5_SETVI|nr:hypothetical protein SEVIR_5G273100v2 [Setaria viridis]